MKTRVLKNGVGKTVIPDGYRANGSRCYCEIYTLTDGKEPWRLTETADKAYRRLLNDKRFNEVKFGTCTNTLISFYCT